VPLAPSPIPIRGAANNTPFIEQPQGFCPLEGIRNVRPFGPDGRRRLAQRPPLNKLFGRQIGGGNPVQGLGVITKASSIAGYDVGSCETVEASSDVSGALAGQVWFLEQNRGMYADDYLDNQNYNGTGGTNSVQSAAVAPSWSEYPDRVAVVSNFTDATSGKTKYVLRLYSPEGAIIASTSRESPYTPKFNHYANPPAISEHFVFVPSRTLVDIFKLSDGSHYGTILLNSWASDVVGCRVYKPTTGNSILWVLHQGSKASGAYTGGIGSGVIQQGKWAQQFRSGVQKWELTQETALNVTPLFRIFGTQKGSGDDYYEAFHGYFRISEQTVLPPHGARVTALAVSPLDGSLFVARCNRGWGPNNGLTDFHPKDPLPFVSLMKITSAGVTAWELDVDSVREVGDGGYINDIPISAGDDPTHLQAICDEDGNCFLAGRRNLNGFSIIKVHRDGYAMWGKTLMRDVQPAAHREGGIAIDPTDQGVVTVGDRNSSWEGATGNAHAWKLDNNSGQIIWDYDLDASVSGLGVAMLSDGRIVYTTDKV